MGGSFFIKMGSLEIFNICKVLVVLPIFWTVFLKRFNPMNINEF